MQIKIFTDTGAKWVKGRSPETIVKRIFGRNAKIYWPRDPSCPHAQVVEVNKYGTHRIGLILVEED